MNNIINKKLIVVLLIYLNRLASQVPKEKIMNNKRKHHESPLNGVH